MMDSAIEFARTAADYVSLNPWWDNSMQPYTMAYTLAALAVFHVLLSVVFGRSKDPNRDWFTMHAVANAVITAMCIPDLLFTIRTPHLVFTVAPSTDAHAVVLALHLYHALVFTLNFQDVLHHFVSVVVVGLLAYLFPYGALVNALDFFICGLPGGIDYALLAGVKWGFVSKITEKRWNVWLNMCVRLPGILCVLYTGVIIKIVYGSSVTWPPSIIILVLHSWNAIYYAERVVRSSAIAHYTQDEARKAKSD